MKEDDFLPEEITCEILRRLPIRSIMRLKCVCKSWRFLIERGHFVTSYTPKPCLAFAHQHDMYTVCDEAFKPLFQFVLPSPHFSFIDTPCDSCIVIDSTDGLILVWHACNNDLFVCNPMTHEYVILPPSPPLPISTCGILFGFGVSKINGQYKILYGIHECSRSWSCYVYTLRGGGGLWRSIVVPSPAHPIRRRLLVAQYSNETLHWLASDVEGSLLICCFDIETELFTNLSLSIPGKVYASQLRIWEDHLYLCDTSNDLHVVIWKMNNYGDANSWIEEYMFDNRPYIHEYDYSLKILGNGDLLLVGHCSKKLFIFSINTNGHRHGITISYNNISSYTPTFLSLTTMGIHSVESLKLK